MPNFQVLDANPGFGSQLGAQLGGGISQGIAGSLNQMFKDRAEQKKLSSLVSLLTGGGQQTPKNGLSEQLGDGQEGSQQGQLSLTPESVLLGSLIDPSLSPALTGLYKEQQKSQKEAQGKDTAQSALNRASELLSEGELGWNIGALKPKAAEARAEFDSSLGSLEAELVDRVSRGTLSNARFKYITENLLPKASDRDSVIRGKLKAISKTLNLSQPEALKEKKMAKKTVKSEKPSGVLMRDPSGALRSVPKDQAMEAQKAGYKLEQ